MYIERKTRTIIKTISWRFCATFITALIVFIFVGRIEIAVLVGGIEMVSKLVLYYFHERVWNKVHLGKQKIEPFVLWFTGLSGSGKVTLADKVSKTLQKKGYNVERLEGDTIRSIFPKTGFKKEERNNHINRIGHLSSVLEKNGIIVISSFISPYKESRDYARSLCNNFIEIFIDTSIEKCEQRDVKGLYKKAREGKIKNFTGVNDPYERPENPEIVVDTETESEKESYLKIIKYIKDEYNYSL